MSLQLATPAAAIATLTFLLLLITSFSSSTSAAATTTSLRRGYYSTTCRQAESIVRHIMIDSLFSSDPRSLASVMRFQFHDCFVNGCDASMLLDDTETMLGEKLSLSNIDSLRSYEVVDQIKSELEKSCPGVVSCADIIIMASRDAVALTGGPYWEVKLGRLDSLTAKLCPQGGDESVTVGLDSTPLVFDNAYFQDLVGGRGFLNSDQTLFTHPVTRKYVEEFSRDQDAFFDAFAEGMIKMGDLQSGLPGEVRTNCRVVNGGREVRDELDRLRSWGYLV
ncbi:Peroxidase 17 [Linum perenne]